MRPTRLAAVVVALVATVSCRPVEPSTLVRADTPPIHASAQLELTPEQGRYLAAVAWHQAETGAFLASVQQLVASTPQQLWAIMWCESGRPYGLPAFQPGWDKTNLHGKSTSSGGAQFVDSTWLSNRPPGAEQWPRAYMAPWFVQLAAANHLYETSGTSPWRSSSGCWAPLS